MNNKMGYFLMTIMAFAFFSVIYSAPYSQAHGINYWNYGVHSPIYYYSGYTTWSEVGAAAQSWNDRSLHPTFASSSSSNAKVWVYDQNSAEAWNGKWEACCYSGTNMIDSNVYLNTRITPANSCCRQGVICHELGHVLGTVHETVYHAVMWQGFTWRHDNSHESPTVDDDDAIDYIYGS